MGRSRGTQLLLALSAAAVAAASASGGITPVVEAAAAEIGGMLTAASTGQHGEHAVGRVTYHTLWTDFICSLTPRSVE